MCKIISSETKLLNALNAFLVTRLYKLTEEGKANLTSTMIYTSWKMCFLVWRCIGCSLSWYHGIGLIIVSQICNIYTCFRKYYPNLLDASLGREAKHFSGILLVLVAPLRQHWGSISVLRMLYFDQTGNFPCTTTIRQISWGILWPVLFRL